MRDTDSLFHALSQSSFRRRCRLNARDRAYLDDKGLSVVLVHARRLIDQRIRPAHPQNDGKQTPMRGHPVFVAQHATATCCRSCLQNWHSINKAHGLTDEEMEHVIAVLGRWLSTQLSNESARSARPNLFSSLESSRTRQFIGDHGHPISPP